MEIRELRYALRALSDMARLRIVQYLALRDGDISVTELTRALRMSQPLASWHLRKLRRAQLVKTRRVGRQVLCSLNRARLGDCSEALELWSDLRSAPVKQPVANSTPISDGSVP
jgi:ArsR family transcriptional regulator